MKMPKDKMQQKEQDKHESSETLTKSQLTLDYNMYGPLLCQR